MGIAFIALLASFGLAMLFFEKSDEGPIVYMRNWLFFVLNSFHSKATKVLDCPVCLSFWMALIVDICLFFYSGGSYFLWPFSGFAACGLTWIVYIFLENINKEETNESIEQNKTVSDEERGS